MKKIFSLLCAMALVLSASAFAPVNRVNAPAKDGRQVNMFKNPAASLKKQVQLDAKYASFAPARKAAQDLPPFDATISVSNITSMGATVAIAPANQTETYYWTLMDSTNYQIVISGGAASMNINTIEDYLAYEINYYTTQYTLAQLTTVGNNSYTYTTLDPNSVWVVLAASIDATTGVLTSTAIVENFTTLEAQESDNVITITYDPATETINFNTTNNDPYFFYIESKSAYDKYQSDYTPASVAAELADWIELMGMFQVDPDNFVLNGNFALPIAMWDPDMESGEYIVMAVPYAGVINGTAASCIFTYTAQPTVITDTVNVHFVPYYNAEGEGGWTDHVADQGWWQYQGETADQSLYVSLSPSVTNQIAGTYTLDDMDLEYTSLFDEVTGDEFAFESLTIVVAENNGVIIITAEGVCKNGIYYIMTFDPIGAPTALKNVDAAVKAVKSIKNGQLVIEKNGVLFNAQGAKL